MSLSFCGCGFLGIYHVGVAKALVNHAPAFLSKIDRVGGSSAGALIGAVLLCDSSKLDACQKFTLDLADNVRKKPLGAWTPNYNILEPVKNFMVKHMPEDGYKKANNVLYISLTKIVKNSYHNDVICTYTSNRHLFENLYAACYIPIYAGTNFPVIDGCKCIDGGMTNNLVMFDKGRTVTVSPFSGDQDICPLDGKSHNSIRLNGQIFEVNSKNGIRFKHAMSPPHRDVLLEYHDTGYSNAVTFLKNEGFYEK